MGGMINNVLITTFISPHLFWVIESKNEKRSRIIHNIKEDLKKLQENPIYDFSFEVGEVNSYNM